MMRGCPLFFSCRTLDMEVAKAYMKGAENCRKSAATLKMESVIENWLVKIESNCEESG